MDQSKGKDKKDFEEISREKLKIEYRDAIKIENEQNWKFTRLLVGLSIGILAFSVQTFDIDKGFKVVWIIYLSWFLLFVSFLAGMFNLHYFQKLLSRKIKRELRKDDNDVDQLNRDINKFEKRNKLVSYILRYSFGFGVLSFCAFKVLQIILK